ncbi:uncharacterized protein LOC132286101 [Cornus florida]|uniref:uncharacterized protein LOC132286101 n=1 Tax=Cornus florida TaxID=4283 RepID=UPI0028971133|nr:uncharacterized protein LOC132286101 [Cornus florida]
MEVIHYLDTMLVPLSLFLTISYHAYLWHNLKNKPSITTIGMHTLRRRAWLQDLNQGDDKKGMLAVQSLRNTLMDTILTASIAIIIVISLAAITNNTYSASHLLSSPIFGSQSGRIVVLKYGAASLFLLISFLCSSMALGCFIDANFLINASKEFSSPGYTRTIVERGFMLSVVGNRMLCITVPLLLWMFGPIPMALSSGALIWGLYELDFAGNLRSRNKQDLT